MFVQFGQGKILFNDNNLHLTDTASLPLRVTRVNSELIPIDSQVGRRGAARVTLTRVDLRWLTPTPIDFQVGS